jgi:predicted dehydrogenase
MVGFNRRFAPHVRKIADLLSGISEPKSFVMTVNAGGIPKSHWTQDLHAGGGRLLGEACHFIDLLRFLAGAPIERFTVTTLGRIPTDGVVDDKVSFSLNFADGSFGHPSFPKERLEVFCSGRVLQLDNYRALRGFGWKNFKSMRAWRQDKGQDACARAFVDAIKAGKESPIPFNEIDEVSRVTIEIAEAARRPR